MIQFEIKKNKNGTGEFSFDLKALALSFFPGQECLVTEREDWVEQTGYPARCQMDGRVVWEEHLPEGYTKNQVKASLYRSLSRLSGRQLPWGILTGIRPAKIPLRMYMDGMSREEIAD